VFICHYTENFTNENPFHKMVYILLAALRLGRIAGLVSTFIMHHFVRSFMRHMRMAQGLPNP